MKSILLQWILVVPILAKNIEQNIQEQLKYECSEQENSVENNVYPWAVFIPLKTRPYNPGANVRCIGALISKQHVITTSTCLQFVVSNVLFGQGDYSQKLENMLSVPVKKWITYEKADIALLKLDEDVPFSDVVRPICLPFQEFKKPKNSTTFKIASWAHEDGSVSVLKKLMEGKYTTCKKETDYHTCFRPTGNDACYGDEGSPVMYFDNNNWVLYGILYNVFDSDGSSCARNSPAVALKITDDVIDWILENLDK